MTCDWLPLNDAQHASLIRVATAIVGPDEAEDVVQNVYLKLLGDHAPFHGRTGASRLTWLTTIVKRAAISHRQARHQVSEATGAQAEPLEAGADVTVPPYDPTRLDDKRRISDVIAHLDTLPPRLQETMRVWLRERSYRRAAAAMGVAVGTFKFQLYRARHKLRALMEETI